jgi:hypothetical protein
LLERDTELTHLRAASEAAVADLRQIQAALEARETELTKTEAALQSCEKGLEELRAKGNSAVHELDCFRHRRLTRWFNRFFDKSTLWDDISSTFQQLKDDSLIFNKGLRSCRLQPSFNLQRVSFLYYPLDLNRPGLAGILLAFIIDFPLTSGTLGIEILSPANDIVRQSFIPFHQINESLPTRFDFPSIPDTDRGRFWLRVFGRDLDGPVRVFEWRKHRLYGLGPLRAKAFCGFLFENQNLK